MAAKDIVVIGASAGGMEALQKLAASLPRDLKASLFVVWHLSPGMKSILPSILSKAGPLTAVNPADGDRIEPGRIYVAPGDHHMLVERGFIRVTKGPKENRFRPAIDPLFRSAAYCYGARAVGVVLSGALDDGTSGLWTIKLRGGTTIVQDPDDAQFRSMPLSAIENVEIDFRLRAGEIGPLLARLAAEEAPADRVLPEPQRQKLEEEVMIAEGSEALEEHISRHGELSMFTCPECHGVLTQLRDGRIVRFRCHTGHAFSSATLLEAIGEQVEDRLWDAVRTLDEAVLLLNQLGEEHAKAGDTAAAERCFDQARAAHEQAQDIRESTLQTAKPSEEQLVEGAGRRQQSG